VGLFQPSLFAAERDRILAPSWQVVCHLNDIPVREIAYALPDGRREMKAARYLNRRINRRVNAKDTALVMRVQQGMRSRRFEPGPLSQTEVCLRDFARRLRKLIPRARPCHPPDDWRA
jgi:phenylpropionate dioxygenase-like ring-hydroxylating dioxygenase large terminal subunit